MKTQLRFTFLVLLIVLAGLLVAPVLAQGQPPTDDDVNAVARQLYCPVCENTPLDVCPTQACAQWRDLIRSMLAEGKSEAEIKQYFVDNYGARVLNEPPREGLNWLVYIVPPLVILVGAVILVRTLRTWKKPQAVPQVEDPRAEAPVDDYVARLEEEVRKKN
jgi:cytochrome c-type biogenesis protein CcmH